MWSPLKQKGGQNKYYEILECFKFYFLKYRWHSIQAQETGFVQCFCDDTAKSKHYLKTVTVLHQRQHITKDNWTVGQYQTFPLVFIDTWSITVTFIWSQTPKPFK